MNQDQKDDPMPPEHYAIRLNQIQWAFLESIRTQSTVPVDGIVLLGGYGDETASENSLVNTFVLVDGDIADKVENGVARASQMLLKTFEHNLARKALKMNPKYSGIDYRSYDHIITAFSQNSEQIGKSITIIHNDASSLQKLIKPLLDQAGPTCKWIGVSK